MGFCSVPRTKRENMLPGKRSAIDSHNFRRNLFLAQLGFQATLPTLKELRAVAVRAIPVVGCKLIGDAHAKHELVKPHQA